MTEASKPVFLVVDAGHTRTKFAVVAAGEVDALPTVLWWQAVMADEPVCWETIVSAICQRSSTFRSILAGSNPPARHRLRENWPAELPPPEVVDRNDSIPVDVRVDQPDKVGVDRLLNALAANRLRGERQPALIVDTGTAVTVDCVSSRGVFHGGSILPGVRMGAQALHNYTATLPHIEPSSMFDRPPSPIGRNTEAAIESGLYWGHVGAVRELVLRHRDQLATFDAAKDAPPLLLITGGAADLLRPHFSHARFEPHLALQGLALVALHSTGTETDD